MALRSGFWNALPNADGDYEPKYNGDDFSEMYSLIIGNGVIRDGTALEVVENKNANTGASYGVIVKAGYGWINGKWFKNPTDDNTTLANITAPTGANKRYDKVVVRRCNNIVGDNNRSCILTVIKGEQTTDTSALVEPKLIQETDPTGEYFDIPLATILVTRGDTLTLSIKDARTWVNGYWGDDFAGKMKLYDTKYNSTLKELQDRADDWIDNTSLTKTAIYREVKTVSTAGTIFNVESDSYNPESDDLAVYVNGYQEFEGVDWSRNGTTITFKTNKIVGTEIAFEITKSLDGVGLNDAAKDIAEYQTNVQEINDYLETFNYRCNGSTDNIVLSDMVNDFLKEDLTDYDCMRIVVHGNFGMTNAYNGTGASNNAYKWLNFANTNGISNRKVILDFANCSQLTFPIPAGTNNILFYPAGNKVDFHNVNFVASQDAANTTIQGAYVTRNDVSFENCRGWITAYGNIVFATQGTYNNCRINCYSSNGTCVAFDTDDLVIVNGGTYWARTTNGSYSTVVYHATDALAAVTILNSVSMPTYSGGGQTNAVRINAGYINMTNCITALEIAATSTAKKEEIGTIPISK